VYHGISREKIVLDKRANLAHQLNSIQVKRTSEGLKNTLHYHIVGKEKSSLTDKKSFCKEAIFSLW